MIRALALAAALALTTAGGASPAAGRLRLLTFVDQARVVHYANGRTATRVLLTSIRVPTGRGPFPLVVFAHGFALTPAPYARLLDAWARAGYVVAAPFFPGERAGAPGGPTEADLGNEPGDIRFVVTRVEAAFPALVDRQRIAVAGQSDGAEAALAVAYDARFEDPRIRAAIVMSGAALPGFTRPRPGSPPLLAVQGTADPINRPANTSSYFALMRRPKFLLSLLGAGHLPPYTTGDAWSPVVRSTTVAFLDRYLRGAPLAPLLAARRSRVARLVAQP